MTVINMINERNQVLGKVVCDGQKLDKFNYTLFLLLLFFAPPSALFYPYFNSIITV